MNSYFERIDLEMIALESAIGAFEAENDITEEYLHDYSDYESPAYESASSSDDFGFNLFEDMYTAPATESGDDGSKGSKLGQGIKNILGNIKKFFVKIKDGLVNFFNSFKKKKAEVNAEKVKENAAPEALKLADTMRGSIKQAYTIIGNITVRDTKEIASICEKISQAITAAGGSDAMVAAHSEVVKAFDSDADTDIMTKAGKSFRDSGYFHGGNEAENGRLAEKKLAEVEDKLAKIKATGQDLDAALENITKIFQKEFTAAYNTMKGKKNTEASVVNDETDFDTEQREEDDEKRAQREGNANTKAVRDYNKSMKERRSVGATITATRANEIPMATLLNQVRQIVFVNYDIKELTDAIESVTKACSTHAANCEKLANKVPANVSGEAKIAYSMCKVLSQASSIYTHISGSIQRLTSGSVFTTNMSDGGGTGSLKTDRGAKIDVYTQSSNTARGNQKKFVDE